MTSKTTVRRRDINVGDTVEFLHRFHYTPAGRVLIYADPSYLHQTRSSSTRYRYEYSVEDHQRLLMRLRDLTDNVSMILSFFPSELYARTLSDWRAREFQAMARGGVRTEKYG